KTISAEPKTCGKCGKTLCSDACRKEHRIQEHGFTCANCGKKFLTYHRIEDKKHNVFCSEDCLRDFSSIKCDNCGAKFLGKYYYREEGKERFCSKNCMEKYFA
ncbi:MAG: hypothetical protein ACTSR3_16510, partial [Candidatus Helarchaeota archaeon]